MNLPSSSSRSHRALPRAFSLALTIATLAVSAHAGERRVTIGEVSSKVARGGVNYESLVRAASEEELDALDLSHMPRGKKVIVSVALVRLDTLTASSRAIDTTCEVSAALRDASGGTMFALLSGKARATSVGTAGAVESTAVRGAIHGALAHIPEALAR
jgi:hypothetical protein